MKKFEKSGTVIPEDPKNDKYFEKTCGSVPKMVNFIGKKCNVIYVATIDWTAEIENSEGDTLFWTIRIS